MSLYAIDPGTTQSAIVTLIEGEAVGGMWVNEMLVDHLNSGRMPFGHVVIEEIQSYGMAVGREVFQTVFWAGRFSQAWGTSKFRTWSLLGRREVKLHLCGSARAKDANIRAALIDKYGGKAATKKGGPLYGIKTHMWAALALAVTYQELGTNAKG